MEKEELVWRHCIAANIKRLNTDSEGNIRHGTKTFPGGRKVYLSNYFSKDKGLITVMGLNRFKSRYVYERVPLSYLENIRCQRTFDPRIVRLMGDWESEFLWWKDTGADRYDIEAYADMLISEQSSGTGYEDYLKNRLICGLEEELLRIRTDLKTKGLYSNASIPLQYLYIGNEGYPKEIVREVINDYPEYLKQWPGLREYME